MEYNPTPRPKLEPPAPVNGGIRWRSRYHDLLDLQQRMLDLKQTDDPAGEGSPARPEPAPDSTEDGAPHIASSPAPEARAGEEYVYQPRAFDGYVSGFTWYFEKSPPGMVVDRHSGMVTWTPSEGGVVEVVLCARSLYGKTARQGWTLCVQRAAVSKPPPKIPRAARNRENGEKRQPCFASNSRAHSMPRAAGATIISRRKQHDRFTGAPRRKNLRGGRMFRVFWRDGRRRIGAGRRATAPPATPHRPAMPLRR